MKKQNMFKAAAAALMLGAATLTAAALIATPAAADIAASKALVDAAKAQGIVGEQRDGYLGFVSGSTDSALQGAVAEINAGRRDVYAEAAAKNGLPIEAAGQSAFSNVIMGRVKAGEYYQDANGAWVRK